MGMRSVLTPDTGWRDGMLAEGIVVLPKEVRVYHNRDCVT